MTTPGAGTTDTIRPTRISEVATVFVPVADQERALAFYVGTLGFRVRADFPYGDRLRWVEVAPPGAANGIALVPPGEGTVAPGDAAHCALTTSDIEADHAALLARGVDVDPQVARAGSSRAGLLSLDATVADPVPPQVSFRDPDGNRFLIVQTG